MRKNMWINRKAKLQRGFSLIEIMAVIILIAGITAVAIPNITGAIARGKRNTTMANISALENAISQFELECSFVPTSLDDLIEAPTARRCKGYPDGGFLRGGKIPLDGWNNEFSYSKPGVKNPKSYDIWSDGKDIDDDSDNIGNWEDEDDMDE